MSRPYEDLDDEHLEVMATMFYDMAADAEAKAERLKTLQKEYKEKAQAYDLEITRRKGMGPRGDEEERDPPPKVDPFEPPPPRPPAPITERMKNILDLERGGGYTKKYPKERDQDKEEHQEVADLVDQVQEEDKTPDTDHPSSEDQPESPPHEDNKPTEHKDNPTDDDKEDHGKSDKPKKDK